MSDVIRDVADSIQDFVEDMLAMPGDFRDEFYEIIRAKLEAAVPAMPVDDSWPVDHDADDYRAIGFNECRKALGLGE